jgi:hypothetical protein
MEGSNNDYYDYDINNKNKTKKKKNEFSGPCLHVKKLAEIRSRGAVKLTYVQYKHDIRSSCLHRASTVSKHYLFTNDDEHN